MTLVVERFEKKSPKRILSLDGGGIRGALTLGYLEKIESILRSRHNRPDMLLCDYYDLIGGTSTGSIIAACLAMGMTVQEVRNKYLDLGGKIFKDKYNWVKRTLFVKFKNKNLVAELKKVFGDMTLGDSNFKTGLCIVLKRADTNSTWFLLNHPYGQFYSFNKDILLWSALTAASAAPSYFEPQSLNVGNSQIGCFIDGGISLSNNPALGLLQVATLTGFPFKWSLGEDNILLTSVGTGYGNVSIIPSLLAQKGNIFWAFNLADYYMQDANWENQAMLQWLSSSVTAKNIDLMRQDLDGDLVAGRPLITYLRYNFDFTTNNLNNLGLGKAYLSKVFSSKDVENILEMSNAKNRYLLYEIGKAASGEIDSSHFPAHFDV
jgi:uncharacterized protein